MSINLAWILERSEGSERRGQSLANCKVISLDQVLERPVCRFVSVCKVIGRQGYPVAAIG